jgi:hypothetical protein
VYLINPLSLQIAQTLFITTSRFRVAQGLVGPKDGVNVVFTTPGSEKFSHNLPFLDVNVYYNGVRLALLDDYMIAESGGAGTGFDTVILNIPPMFNDHLFSDYVLAASP